ncbi:hypothetical protein EXIGLDRAFT_774791 [Exidia glandulosa HHB12029]|uniref:Uncharacterized protein n=1 Tax=Exidia glandulosa HHB12029 TaxID=1314781 RepID=A0A165E7U1_EXIGL|nr:hypothetical protein EXIGLDRAFT_774791 [Exidia glandulosa HHB12029]
MEKDIKAGADVTPSEYDAGTDAQTHDYPMPEAPLSTEDLMRSVQPGGYGGGGLAVSSPALDGASWRSPSDFESNERLERDRDEMDDMKVEEVQNTVEEVPTSRVAIFILIFMSWHLGSWNYSVFPSLDVPEDGHGIVAALLPYTPQLARIFPYALTDAEKATQPRGKHPPGDSPCVLCGAARASNKCKFWLCATHCALLRLPCSRPDHQAKGAMEHPDQPRYPSDTVVRLEALKWLPDNAAAPIVADDGDDVEEVDAPVVIVHIHVTHYWRRNPVREADSRTFDTAVVIPDREDMSLLPSDLTATALADLMLSERDIEALTSAPDEYDAVYEYTFHGPDDDAVFDWSDEGNRVATLSAFLLHEGQSIGRFVRLEPAEEDDSFDRDLGWLNLEVKCTHYTQGFCSGNASVILATAKVPRRRLDINSCHISLSDLSNDVKKELGLTDIPTLRIDDGQDRHQGQAHWYNRVLTSFTSLNIVHNPHADLWDQANLELRVHGPQYNPWTNLAMEDIEAAVDALVTRDVEDGNVGQKRKRIY